MANPTTNYGFVMPSPTDLVTDLPADFDVFGQAVDTQMLTNANAAIAKTIVDAKGDLIGATAADTPARLAVGTNGQVLTADSTAATGLKWATAGGGGKVLQVVQGTTTTSVSITSSSYTDTNLTASITPSSATSKILVLTTQQFVTTHTASSEAFSGYQLVRGATAIQNWAPSGYESMGVRGSTAATTYAQLRMVISTNYLDSPATTSSVTYKTQAKILNSQNITLNENSAPASIILLEIGA
jgi:hypothetical protein